MEVLAESPASRSRARDSLPKGIGMLILLND